MVQDVGAEIVDGVERAGQFAIKVDDEVVTLLSLPPGAFAKIQERTGLRWINILLDPIGRMDVAADLVDAAYAKVGKPVPELDVGAIVRLFVELPGDLPDPVQVAGGGDENPTDAT